jgi:hypothetical protein
MVVFVSSSPETIASLNFLIGFLSKLRNSFTLISFIACVSLFLISESVSKSFSLLKSSKGLNFFLFSLFLF